MPRVDNSYITNRRRCELCVNYINYTFKLVIFENQSFYHLKCSLSFAGSIV